MNGSNSSQLDKRYTLERACNQRKIVEHLKGTRGGGEAEGAEAIIIVNYGHTSQKAIHFIASALGFRVEHLGQSLELSLTAHTAFRGRVLPPNRNQPQPFSLLSGPERAAALCQVLERDCDFCELGK